MVTHVSEFGKYRANLYASPTNNLQLSDNCGCSPCTVAQDHIVIHDVEDVAALSIVYNGTTYYAPEDTITEQQIEDWLYSIVKDIEVDPFISVTFDCYLEELPGDGGPLNKDDVTINLPEPEEVCDVIIDHIGCGTFEDAVWVGPVTGTDVRWTNIETYCSYRYSFEGASGDLSDGTQAEEPATGTYNYTGVIVTDAATAATLLSDIEDVIEGFSDIATVEVAVDDVAGEFIVIITSPKGLYTWSMDGNAFISAGCVDQFAVGR